MLNVATCLIVDTVKFDHITQVLSDVLHWLPADTVHGSTHYLWQCLWHQSIMLWSCLHSGDRLFCLCSALISQTWWHVRHTHIQLCERSFHVAAALVVWNILPLGLHSASVRQWYSLSRAKSPSLQSGVRDCIWETSAVEYAKLNWPKLNHYRILNIKYITPAVATGVLADVRLIQVNVVIGH